jgi:hypothetical protein
MAWQEAISLERRFTFNTISKAEAMQTLPKTSKIAEMLA